MTQNLNQHPEAKLELFSSAARDLHTHTNALLMTALMRFIAHTHTHTHTHTQVFVEQEMIVFVS